MFTHDSLHYLPGAPGRPPMGARAGATRKRFRIWVGLLGTVLMTCACVDKVQAAPRASRGAPVVFSRPAGVFTNAFELSLSTKIDGASVRFTLDGSEPRIDSVPYVDPMLITNSVEVRARAFDRDGASSATVARQFIQLHPDLARFTSNLPLLLISNFGASFNEKEPVTGNLTVFPAEAGRSSPSELAEFQGPIQIRQRGRASLKYRKHSYTIKMLTESGDNADIPLLGMPKDCDWVLYGPHPDKTLMRDVLAYEMSNRLGQWAPRTRFVEVFLSQDRGAVTTTDYVGVYVLVEKIKRSEHRVAVERLGTEHHSLPQLAGGYIFKKDHSDAAGFDAADAEGGPPFMTSTFGSTTTGYPTGPGGFPGDPAGFLPPYTGRATSVSSSSSSSGSFRSARTGPVTNVIGRAVPAPKASRTVPVEEDGEIVRFEEIGDTGPAEGFTTSVLTNRFYFVEPERDEITGVQSAWLREHLNEVEGALRGPDFANPTNGYPAYLDVDSFIDYHLLVETTKNVDGFRFSTFYHKDRGGRIRMGPAWDWNLSFGNCNAKQGHLPEYWLWPQLNDREYSWFRRLFEDPDFGQRYVDRWWALRKSEFATSNLLGRVTELATYLDAAQRRNFERWPVLGVTVKPNWYVGETYEEEIAWMKDWLAKRLAWIDAQFIAPPALATDTAGRRLLQSDRKGAKILFTTDGSDPRRPGGGVSDRAVEYRDATDLPATSRIFARVRLEGRWSGPLIAAE